MMIWPRAACFQWPVSSFRISMDISNSSRLSTTRHHSCSRFLNQSKVLDSELGKSLSSKVPTWRAISLTDNWKRLLFSPEIQKIPPEYSSLSFCRQRNSTARDVFPTPPRPQIADSEQPLVLFFNCTAIAFSSLSRPQKQRLRLGSSKMLASTTASRLPSSNFFRRESNWVCPNSKTSTFEVRLLSPSFKEATADSTSFCLSSNKEMFCSFVSWRSSIIFILLEISSIADENSLFFSDCAWSPSSSRLSMSDIRFLNFAISSMASWRASPILLASSALNFFMASKFFSKLVTSILTSFIKSLSTGQPIHNFKPAKKQFKWIQHLPWYDYFTLGSQGALNNEEKEMRTKGGKQWTSHFSSRQ